MKKLLLYITLAVVVSLSAFPKAAEADTYDCPTCRVQPFEIANSLYFYAVDYDVLEFDITWDPEYPQSLNNEDAWDHATWGGPGAKPGWNVISNAAIHDGGAARKSAILTYLTYENLKDVVVPGVQMDVGILTADVVAMEETLGVLPSAIEFTGMETALNGKMDTPAGSTSQYVRGDGSLDTFPTIPAAQVQSDWTQGSSGAADFIKNKPSLATVATSGAYTDLSGKPSLGTAAALNVAAAGNAASGEVVKGNDSRLTDSRTPTAHTHDTADVTSGTFADARIAQSNVTQHQAALSIGASQVTGTKTSSFISDFAEAAQDNALGVVTAGAGLSYTYNDAGNAASISLASKTYQSPTFNSATTATQLSSTTEADVFYAFDGTVTISLLAGQSVTATLKYADNSGMSTNVVTVDSATTSNSGVLNLTQTNTLRIGGKIPAGKYRQVTFAVAGSGAAAPTTIKAGQEAF